MASFVDGANGIDVMWGDLGCLCFTIPPPALASRRFAAITGELPCG
jgi:hypothetical protein